MNAVNESAALKPLTVRVIPVTAFAQNCSLLKCEQTGDAALIDPGGDVAILLEQVKKHHAQVRQIFITHGHVDHAAAAPILVRALQEEYGYEVPIIGPHSADQYWLDDLAKRAQAYGFAAGEAFVPTRYLNDGDTVKVGEHTLQVLHCPGHTPGHVVFFHEAMRLAWVGDVLFEGAIGRTDFPGGNHADLIRAIKEKLLPLGDDVQFVSGHGPISNFGHERKYNPYL